MFSFMYLGNYLHVKFIYYSFKYLNNSKCWGLKTNRLFYLYILFYSDNIPTEFLDQAAYYSKINNPIKRL